MKNSLSLATITENLSSFLPPLFFHIRQTTGSTNDDAFERALNEAPEGTVVLAEHQTQGHGRLGRSWESPSYKNIYLSLILRPPISATRVQPLTLIAGLACYRTLESLPLKGLRLKWPNDVFVGSKKLAGVLTQIEVKAHAQTRFVIVGIGINVNAGASDFSEGLRCRATSLFLETQTLFSRSELVARLLESFFHHYRIFLEKGFSPFKAPWEAASQMKGQEIRIQETHTTYAGICEGLDEQGHLLVRGPSGLQTVMAGDA